MNSSPAVARVTLVLTALLAPSIGRAQTETAKLTASDAAAADQFGNSVAVSDDTAVVGARFDADNGSGSGSAYVFERDAGGADQWGQVAKLTASDGAASDSFGWAVAVSGDTVVVGAVGDDDAGPSSGSAYVFQWDEGGVGTWGQVAKLTAADAAENDQFGWTVAICGDTAVVGAHFDDDDGSESGSAYVFERDAGGAGQWGQVQKLTASDADFGDEFGWSVAISADTVVVGAWENDDNGNNSGSAYVYGRNEGGADTWGEVTKLTPADGAAADHFGYSVSVSGETALVAAYTDDDLGSGSGSAYVYGRDTGGTDNWGEVTKLTASDGGAADFFGWSVAISADRALVGAYAEDGNGLDSGAAYLFERDEGGADNWGEVAKVSSSDGAAGDLFGGSVSVSGDTALVGARDDDDAGSNSGSAYVFSGGRAPGLPSCFGVLCPCGNDDPSAGCANSTGLGGRLSGSGSESVAADDLVLTATQLSADDNGLFYMGDTVAASWFFDGLQCAVGNTFRFQTSIQGSGSSGTMSFGPGIAADSGGLITPGTTGHFHCWHRDFPASPCGTGANLTHLYSVTFTP